MGDKLTKKKVKRIIVDIDKCNGCRACELACSAFHAKPRYSSMNPARSRIQVVIDMLNDEYVPIRAAEYSKAGCKGRSSYKINDKEYSECSFCGTVCPERDLFKDPDSGLPMRCDMCEGEEVPLCVQACPRECLTYQEVYDIQEVVKRDEIEIAMKALIEKYGLRKIVDSVTKTLKTG